MTVSLLQPLVALILWTTVMWFWMYLTRIPAMTRLNIKPEPEDSNALAALPARVRWKADNYNHLHEQPTLFYALVLTLAVLEVDSGTAVVLAWAYVALRIVHSLIQVLGNRVLLRFGIFVLASISLFALLGITIQAVLR